MPLKSIQNPLTILLKSEAGYSINPRFGYNISSRLVIIQIPSNSLSEFLQNPFEILLNTKAGYSMNPGFGYNINPRPVIL